MWTKRQNKQFNSDDELILVESYTSEREGVIANDYKCGNAHSIERHKNYNGSGEKAFNGAKEWVVVSAKVGFQTGEEAKADLFVEKLKNLIDEFFDN